LDIIDHLHRVYNIYCVAAAGDTLRNYFSNKKNNGEYFLDALASGSPRLTEGLRKHTRRFARLLRKHGAITEEEFETREEQIRFACHPAVIDLRR